ncbi:hypothetical protein KCP69_04615 [Salmonella enterica subsp. enterica]|nr:hypothetical protein KCP69_04615 [Salmonella enterica subsp. enterica]
MRVNASETQIMPRIASSVTAKCTEYRGCVTVVPSMRRAIRARQIRSDRLHFGCRRRRLSPRPVNALTTAFRVDAVAQALSHRASRGCAAAPPYPPDGHRQTSGFKYTLRCPAGVILPTVLPPYSSDKIHYSGLFTLYDYLLNKLLGISLNEALTALRHI